MNCLQTARAWGYPYDYLRQKREAKAATPKKRQRSHDNLRDRRPTSASEKPLEMRLNRMSHYDLEGNVLLFSFHPWNAMFGNFKIPVVPYNK